MICVRSELNGWVGNTVDLNYFALENICENGRKLGWENFCDQIFLRKFITTIITI